MADKYNYSDSFQKLIVALMVRDSRFLPQFFDVCNPEYFDYKTLQIITSVILSYYSKYSQPPNYESIQNEVKEYEKKFKIPETLGKEIEDVISFVYTVDMTDIDYIRDKVIEFGRDQKLKDAIITSSKIIENSGNVESIRKLIDSALDIGGDYDLGVSFNDIALDVSNYVRKDIRYDPEKIIRTGFQTLDNSMLAKGTARGDLCVVVGPPGKGKTTFLVNIMANAIISGFNVCYITIGDMTESDIILRLAARLSGISQEEIIGNSSMYTENMNTLMGIYKLGQIRMKSYRANSVTVSGIKSYLSRLKAVTGCKLDMFIADYVDNLLFEKRAGTYEPLGEIYNELSKLAGEEEMVGWTASQPKVDNWEAKQINLSSMAESSKKGHVSDLVVTLSVNPPALYIAKNRRGKDNVYIKLKMDGERMIMKEDNNIEIPTESIASANFMAYSKVE